ncbi:MAG: hypothetical protein AAF960_18800 [Bacteroidota bacterium]
MSKSHFILLFIIVLFTNCQAQKSTWNNAPDLNDGWTITNPASVGINEDSLTLLFNYLRDFPHPDFRAIIVAKDGKLVLEEYFNSFWRNNIHDIRSAGKSVTSMLAGIAMEKGCSNRRIKWYPFFLNTRKLKMLVQKNRLLPSRIC